MTAWAELLKQYRIAPCDCETCRATRAYQYGGLRCCPRRESHGMNCICGMTSLATRTPEAP